MSSNTTILITGGNRGLGTALVETYLSRPSQTVIAAVRDPSHSTSLALNNLPTGKDSKLIIVKIDASSPSDPAAAVQALESTYDITSLDTVIANAGIAKVFPRVHEATPEEMMEHYNINVIGVILLFQALRPLLLSGGSGRVPKFVTMGSGSASLTNMEIANVPNTPYASSKVALNHVTRRIHLENEGIVAFPVDPGWVQTDMGNLGAKLLAGLEKAPLTVEESIAGVAKVIDEATRDNYSGKFVIHDGTFQDW